MLSTGEIGTSRFDCGAELGSTPFGVLGDCPHHLASPDTEEVLPLQRSAFLMGQVCNKPCFCMGDFSHFLIIVSL